MNENGLNYIDLFAGAGGLSEGFIHIYDLHALKCKKNNKG